MKNLLSEVLSSIEGSLDLTYKTKSIDPRSFNQNKNDKIRLWLGVLYTDKLYRLQNNKTHSLTMTDIIFSYENGNTLFFEKDFEDDVLVQIINSYNLLNLQNIEEYDIVEFYQKLLNFESNSNVAAQLAETKGSRKRSGSYYTPSDLSTVSITQQLNEIFLNRNEMEIKKSIESMKVIDFSSGTGSYLISYVISIKKIIEEKKINIDLGIILRNIYAVDVDYIALQIAKLELCIFCNCYNIKDFNKNYILGNPLLENTLEKIPNIEKYSYSAQGFIYHEKLALTIDDLKAFPEEGFDLIIGNPPWEKIRLEEKSFFKPWSKEIGESNKKDIRSKLILELDKTSPALFSYYDEFKKQIELARKYMKTNFPLTGVGELNTYALFTELALKYKSTNGVIIYLVKSALVISKVYSEFFKELLDKKLLYASYDFINTNKIFDIDSRERFILLVLKPNSNIIKYKANLKKPTDILNDDIDLDKRTLSLLNPETNMLPNIEEEKDLLFMKKIYANNLVFTEQFCNTKFGRIVHFTAHAEDIFQKESESTIPIYEGKFIDLYDGKYSTFEGVSDILKYASKAQSRIMTIEEKFDLDKVPESRFFITKNKWASLTKNYSGKFSLMWRSLTSATNKRTMIATILPHQPTSQSIQLLQIPNPTDLIYLLSIFNSIVFDYVVKLKLSGIDMTQAIIKQMPIPDKFKLTKMIDFNGISAMAIEHIENRVYKLYENDIRMANFNWEYLNKELLDYLSDQERMRIIADLDIIIGYLYNIDKKELKMIAQSFDKFYSEQEIDEFFNEDYVIKSI